MPYLAGDDEGEAVRYTVEIPSNSLSLSAWSGAVSELAKARNWEENGTWTAEGIAAAFRDAVEAATWEAIGNGNGEDMDVAIIRDVKSQGTNGGTFTSGAYRQRDLNTEVSDPGSIVSVGTNEFTLVAGTFFLLSRAPCYRGDGNILRLENVTDAIDYDGQTADCEQSAPVQGYAYVQAVFEIASAKTFQLHHRCVRTQSTNGFGLAANLQAEVYSEIVIMKVA